MAAKDANFFPLARTPNSTQFRTNTAWKRASGLGYVAPADFYTTFGNTALTPKELGIIIRAWTREVAGKNLDAGVELQWFRTAHETFKAGKLEAAYGENKS